jgi:hypothetical protein
LACRYVKYDYVKYLDGPRDILVTIPSLSFMGAEATCAAGLNAQACLAPLLTDCWYWTYASSDPVVKASTLFGTHTIDEWLWGYWDPCLASINKIHPDVSPFFPGCHVRVLCVLCNVCVVCACVCLCLCVCVRAYVRACVCLCVWVRV